VTFSSFHPSSSPNDTLSGGYLRRSASDNKTEDLPPRRRDDHPVDRCHPFGQLITTVGSILTHGDPAELGFAEFFYLLIDPIQIGTGCVMLIAAIYFDNDALCRKPLLSTK